MSNEITASFKSGSNEQTGIVVNPGDWFGNAWLLSEPMGNFASHYIVEADTASDAIDEFSDSEYGGSIHIEGTELEDYDPDSLHYDGQGRPIDTEHLSVSRASECLYHGEGIPAGGITPLQFSELQNCSDEVRAYIVALPGGLSHSLRKEPVTCISETWEAARAIGRSEGFDAALKFQERLLADDAERIARKTLEEKE